MLIKLMAAQQKWATPKVLIILTIVYFIFPLYLLPMILPEGRPLDLHLYYSADEAFKLIASYGEENRKAYIVGSATIDILYPLCYSTFLGLVLTFFITRIYGSHDKINYLRVFPYTILVADIFENLSIISLLSQYPFENRTLAFVASLLTSTKWFLFAIVVLMLLYFPIRYYNDRKDKQLLH
ncbi:hypothetical protein AAD001_03575 [Colwelliaceae bacterium 6471]